MHAGEQQGLDDGPLPGRVDVTRGVVVIVLAVLIGGFLLYRGVSDGPQEVAASDATGSTLSAEGSVADETAGPATGSTLSVDGTATDGTATDGTATDGTATDGTATGSATSITGTDGSTGDASTGSDPSTSAITATTAGTGTTTSSASVTTALTGPAGVTVLVLNAASEKGVAGKGTEILDDAGYNVMAPKNADALGPSEILFTAGNESLAEAVAEALEADTGLVAALDPSAPPIGEYGSADVIVVIGTDGAIDVSGG